MKEKSKFLLRNIRRKLFDYLIIFILILLAFVSVANVIWGISFEQKFSLSVLTVILVVLTIFLVRLNMRMLVKSDEMIDNLLPLVKDISDKYQKRPILDIKFDQTLNPDRNFVRSERKLIGFSVKGMLRLREGHKFFLPFNKDVNVYFQISNIGVNMAENVNFVIKLPNSIEVIEPSEKVVSVEQALFGYLIKDSAIPGIKIKIPELIGVFDEKASTLNEKRESVGWLQWFFKVKVKERGTSIGFCFTQCKGVSSKAIPLKFVCDSHTSPSK